MRTKHVVVEKYDPEWKTDFEAIRQELEPVLDGLILSIEHVGSTSVPGLSAKPIIDADIVIPDDAALPLVVARLSSIGYVHEGDLGIPGREAFTYGDKPHLREHHLYVCPKNSPELRRHVAFREYLRAHPDAVAEYSRVKEEAAALYPDSIEKYMDHKSACIHRLYNLCGQM